LAIPAAPPAKPLITFDWYRGFLQFLIDTNSAGCFSYVIVFGELAVLHRPRPLLTAAVGHTLAAESRAGAGDPMRQTGAATDSLAGGFDAPVLEPQAVHVGL
jgi:hypothetical protein